MKFYLDLEFTKEPPAEEHFVFSARDFNEANSIAEAFQSGLNRGSGWSVSIIGLSSKPKRHVRYTEMIEETE